jgi:hypothetical protein
MPTEMRHFSKSFNWLSCGILLALLTIPVAAQPFQCENTNGVPPTVRAEGSAELMGDIVFDCIGGTPTPPGQLVPQVNIAVQLDTYVSSKVTGVESIVTEVGTFQVQFLEALLLVDEPTSQINPTVPILNCGNTSTPDNTAAGPGVCQIFGGGSSGAAATYNGTAGHPNVFQGRSLALITGQQNQVIFIAVPIDPPGTICPNQATQPICHRIIRITNIRGNATTFGVTTGNSTAAVHAQTIVNPASGLPIDNPASVVARVQLGLTSTVGTSSVRLQEAYANAWKPKNISLSLANGTIAPYGYLGGTNYPPDAAQNVIGFVYDAESGFQWQNNGPNGPPSPNPPTPFGPVVPNNGNPFHSAGLGGSNTGIDSSGVANAGTRLAVRFGNIPPGASLQIPQTVQLHNVITNTITGVMVRTNTDSAGAGSFSPASGTLTSSSNLAVYEVLFANPGALEYADVPFTLLNAPANTNLQVTSALAPYYIDSAANVASSTYPVPRFRFAFPVLVLPIGIDIKPGAFPNTINLKSGGTLPVAVLSSVTFDARNVNPLTVTLDGATVKANPKGTPNFSFQDVNGDGLLDLLVHISIDELQLSATDTQATLSGQTFGGQSFSGTDSVKVIH